MEFPKILIIGQTFNKKTGGGVTMSNLFKGWPKNKLAVAATGNLSKDLDSSVCEMYYQLGYRNKLHPFPLNIILPKITCGLLPVNENKPGPAKKAGLVSTTFIYDLVVKVLHFSGLYNVCYKTKITPEFESWVKAYNPDIIYSQLASLELIRFVDALHTATNKRIAIHMMDDWPLTINKPGILFNYWNKVIDREFRKLLDKSSVLLSICEEMSDEYRKRYHQNFLPFHNPIDIHFWKPPANNKNNKNDKFTILYAGRIGYGISSSIADIADAVNEIAKTNKNIIFEIQTGDTDLLQKIITMNEQVKWVAPVDYALLPAKFSGVDLLVLPQDFDEVSVRFLKFSFPTKVSEYMISGTPILVYGQEQTALTQYALREKWGYVVTKRNKTALIQAITDLWGNTVLRSKLTQTAQQLAIEKEDSEKIREQFRNCFMIKENNAVAEIDFEYK